MVSNIHKKSNLVTPGKKENHGATQKEAVSQKNDKSLQAKNHKSASKETGLYGVGIKARASTKKK